jgi:polysaccharide pyruvyl transferase WcaK-like protein
MGASLDTGNLGVSALLTGTVKCIRRLWPDAGISLLGGGPQPTCTDVRLGDGRVVRLGCVGIRCNKTLWRANHLLRLFCTATLLRLLPGSAWRQRLLGRNRYLGAIVSARCVADITGGDSFSDIYGMRRFLLGTLAKLLVLMAGADLVLLPQTYGPFRRRLTRWLARGVLARAAVVLARDRQSLQVIRDLMGRRRMRATPRYCPDVAFVLDSIAPQHIATNPAPLPPRHSANWIGLNISGLLYNGGYNRRNMFELRVDYAALVEQVARALLARPGVSVLVVPHVFTPPGDVESDVEAGRRLQVQLQTDFPGRVYVLEGIYDPAEIKYVIGQTDFFVGSRMHACIAALSQGIVAVPLAYSRKFAGVFDTIGLAGLVVDLREHTVAEVVEHVLRIYDDRAALRAALVGELPALRERVFSSFAALESVAASSAPYLRAAGAW